MKKTLLLLSSLIFAHNTIAKRVEPKTKSKLMAILQNSKVVVKTESSADGGRTGNGGGGAIGPKKESK